MSFTVSVVIPCRDAELWIDAALRSVAAQRHPPCEVIVIDDASRDRSIQQVRAAGVDVHLLAGPGGNAARARNIGIRAARGEWIAFLDADDVWHPDHLARAREMLQGGSDVAFMANHEWIDVAGHSLPMPPSLRHRLPTGRSLSATAFVDVLAGGFHFGHSTVIVRRDRSLEVGAFDEAQLKRHDIDHWLRVLSGRTWSYQAHPAAGYRMGTGGISGDTVSCEVWWLGALLKNRDAGYATPAMDQLIRTAARRAMSLAFVDGSAEELRRARELAWPHLAAGFRAFYRASVLSPRLFRAGIRLKRHARRLRTGA